jgi:hypothetical protein
LAAELRHVGRAAVPPGPGRDELRDGEVEDAATERREQYAPVRLRQPRTSQDVGDRAGDEVAPATAGSQMSLNQKVPAAIIVPMPGRSACTRPGWTLTRLNHLRYAAAQVHDVVNPQ